MEDAIVITADVLPGTGILAGEPVTTAVLRDDRHHDHVVRIVGGPTKSGGFARLAGHVVPAVGVRVPLDLREPPRAPRVPLSVTSWVPNTPAGTWDLSKLPLTFVLSLPRSRDLGGETLGELDVATRTWGRPGCTSFRARSGEERLVTSGDDGINAVIFHDDAWPAELVPGALGQTVVHLDRTGKLRDADIHLNGADFRFSNDGAPGTQDARGVLVHEIGHALGLGHSTDPRATMNLAGSGLRWRSLEKDDVDGVCALYPGLGSAGCDADPCPAGFVCIAAACQRHDEAADVCAPCTPEPGACEAAGDDARCMETGSGSTGAGFCGRGCARDADCGIGFACRSTTEAGDLQCVSRDGCRKALAAATPPDGGVTSDAGAARGTDGLLASGGGGCACETSATRPAPWAALALCAVVLRLTRRNPRRGPIV